MSAEHLRVRLLIEKAVIRPIVACLAPDEPPLPAGAWAGVVDTAASFVSRQIHLAPLHVRVGAVGLGAVLRLWLALLTPGPTGAFGAPLRAARAVALFERLPGPARSVVRLYRSMTVLAYYEHPVVAAALDLPNPAARRDAFRATRRARLAEKPTS
jgi:hypothetical protein